MKEIIGIKSVDGNYFSIGKIGESYFLRNAYTEIPNEFGAYNIHDVEILFNDLCRRVPDCREVEYASGHPNSCMCVIYSDMSQTIYSEVQGVGKNLCAYTSRTASYSEFINDGFAERAKKLFSIDHMRWVCQNKTGNVDVVLNALRSIIEDDYIDVKINKTDSGRIEFCKFVYGFPQGSVVTLHPDGTIDKDGGYKLQHSQVNGHAF